MRLSTCSCNTHSYNPIQFNPNKSEVSQCIHFNTHSYNHLYSSNLPSKQPMWGSVHASQHTLIQSKQIWGIIDLIKKLIEIWRFNLAYKCSRNLEPLKTCYFLIVSVCRTREINTTFISGAGAGQKLWIISLDINPMPPFHATGGWPLRIEWASVIIIRSDANFIFCLSWNI